MTPASQVPGDLSNVRPAPRPRGSNLQRHCCRSAAKRPGRSRANCMRCARSRPDDRHRFRRYLATVFSDSAALRAAAEHYLADSTAEAAAALAQAGDPPRQELLRRMNMAPGGTSALIAMRSEITPRLRAEPELKLLDADLRHLFASWFNRGFLELRRIDWQSPAAVLEKLIAYEAVHEIHGWDDLRRRLAPDRRCFAFFHPVLPDGPDLRRGRAGGGTATAVQPLLSHDTDENVRRAQAERADTAIFYSIQLPGGPARYLVRQLPDQTGGRGVAGRVSGIEAFLHAVAGAGFSPLARPADRGWSPSRRRPVAGSRDRRLVA